jgi:hypothetical protein
LERDPEPSSGLVGLAPLLCLAHEPFDRYTRRSFAPPPGFPGLASSTFELTNNLRQAETLAPDKTDKFRQARRYIVRTPCGLFSRRNTDEDGTTRFS